MMTLVAGVEFFNHQGEPEYRGPQLDENVVESNKEGEPDGPGRAIVIDIGQPRAEGQHLEKVDWPGEILDLPDPVPDQRPEQQEVEAPLLNLQAVLQMMDDQLALRRAREQAREAEIVRRLSERRARRRRRATGSRKKASKK